MLHAARWTPDSGTIDVRELRETLAAIGQHPTDEDLFVMISQVG